MNTNPESIEPKEIPIRSSLRIKRLQVIYDHEINASISWFWDGGFHWKLGDDSNGILAEGWTETPEEALEQMWGGLLHYALENNMEELRLSLLKNQYQ